MIKYGFREKLDESNQIILERQMRAIEVFFSAANKIEPVTDVNLDKMGCDVIVHYPNGSHWFIDRKMRIKGCSRYWELGTPDIAPEIWSVVPEKGMAGVPGWTLDMSKQTDWVVCAYHPADTRMCYCIDFNQYRDFFIRKKDDLVRAKYQTAFQDSGSWRSQCMFLPITVLRDAGVYYLETEI
jgi:hypothetical protein